MKSVSAPRSSETSAATDQATPQKRMLIVHNPVAGWWQRNKLKRFLQIIRHSGSTISVRETKKQGDATAIAAESVDQNIDAIVAAGGDGTVREAAKGLVGSDVAIGFLPLGTANILALELGLESKPEAVARSLEEAKPTDCYSGIVNDDRFLLMVSAGIDSRVVARVSPKVKRILSQGAYAVAAIQELFSSNWNGPIEAVVNGKTITADLIIVTKARHYAGPFCIAPDADLRSTDLYVVAPKGRGFWAMIRYASALLTNRLHKLADVEVIRTDKVDLVGPFAHPVQADGDLLGTLPVTIQSDTACPYKLLWPDASTR